MPARTGSSEVSGLGQAAITEIRLVRAAALRLMQGEVMKRPLLGSWDKVVQYCRAAMGFEMREQFRILFLDKRNRLLADEVQGHGTVDHTPVYIREVLKRALGACRHRPSSWCIITPPATRRPRAPISP